MAIDNRYQLYQTLDDPRRIVGFRLDEAIPLFIAVGVGFLLNAVLSGCIAGAVMVFTLRFIKKGRDKWWQPLLYWYGPASLAQLIAPASPPSAQRYYLR